MLEETVKRFNTLDAMAIAAGNRKDSIATNHIQAQHINQPQKPKQAYQKQPSFSSLMAGLRKFGMAGVVFGNRVPDSIDNRNFGLHGWYRSKSINTL